ncbi:MAG: serine/threonine protein kinase [Flavobacteriaceae bacterium]|nr:MAG: serine/threonine protein kinase [Flavobacteriaceae bacterium]
MNFLTFLKSKRFLMQIALAAVVIVVFVFLLFKWLNISTNHDQKIEVPNLSKMVLDEVGDTLSELDLAYKIIDSASYNPNFPPKSVIEQSPEAGDFVKEKRKIYLTLNPSNYRNVTIPEFYGKTKRNISPVLIAQGFRISTDYIIVSDIALGVVRGMKFKGKSLEKGDKIPKNSLLTLVLGDGEGTGRYNFTEQKN